MVPKIHAKFEEKPICCVKSDKNLVNSDQVKKYRRVMFDAKFEGKLTCAFKNDTSNLVNFRQRTFESAKIWNFIWIFQAKQKMYELKIYRGAMRYDNKDYAKVEQELIGQFKIDMRKLTKKSP